MSTRNGNGTIKWAAFAFGVLLAIVAVVSYGSTLKAAADYNRIEIDALKLDQKEILQMVHRMDRKLVAITTKLGIHEEKRK